MTLRYFIILIICIGFYTVKAQDSTATATPKIGLVLSGGGAKGFAHIGVLKVIDSLGIKIDYVAGTSMGAVIGSLYASGYSGKQLEGLFNTQDFNLLINDEYPRASKSFYERENDQRYAISLPFDKLKIRLPSALSKGQNVYNLLSRLLLPVDGISDFSKLPIPFFCIATDVETGESLILENGHLVEAVTASSALPSLFQPVVIGDKILIDGGVTNNFPVEELLNKGVDVIIGVDVQDDLKDREDLKSGLDVLLQINNFRTINAMKSKTHLTDVYIKPDITNFSVISFDEGKDIIANGEAAAKVKLDALIPLQSKIKKTKPQLRLPDSLKLNYISVSNNKKYTRSYLLGKLKLKANETVSFSTLEQGIQNLMSTNNFDIFNYRLEPLENNTYNLRGKIRESENTTFLKLGAHYDRLYKSAALVNITQKRVLFNNDIAALDVIIGDNSRYNFNYFLDKGFYISVGVNSRFNQFNKNINPLLVLDQSSPLITGLNKIEIDLQDFTNQAYIQTIFKKDFALRLGTEYKRLKVQSETIISPTVGDDFLFENTGYFSLYGNLTFDNYNDALFPSKGFYFSGDIHTYLNASKFNSNFNKFTIAKIDFGSAFKISNKIAAKFEANTGFKAGSKTTKSLDFALGGYGNNLINNFYSFYGYDYLSISGDSFIKAGITLDYKIFKNQHLLASANYANIEDGLFEGTNWLEAPNYTGYALGYSIETFIGPLEAKYTFSPENKEGYWFFNLGFWF